MGRENESEAAGWTFGWQTAYAGGTAGASVALAYGLGMTGAVADAPTRRQRPTREAHHQQTGDTLLFCSCDRRRRRGEEEFPIVDLVHGDVVLGVIACVCAGAELGADGYVGGYTDDTDADAVVYEGCDCFVDVARVGGQEGAVDDHYFSGTM